MHIVFCVAFLDPLTYGGAPNLRNPHLHKSHIYTNPNLEEDSELPKVLLKVLFWALLKVLLLGKVLFKVLKKVLEIVQYPKKC